MAAEAAQVAVDVSEWRDAPFDIGGERIFAIGDVHGCAAQLAGLIERMRALGDAGKSRLVFLGDLVCRGPSSIGALEAWASPALDGAFGRVHRITGNHEQLLMLSVGGGELGTAAWAKWATIGGDTFLAELRSRTGRADAPLSRELLEAGVGPAITHRLAHLEHHVRIANTVLVHGGVDPSLDIDAALAHPFTSFGGNHWAWIMEPFLAWRQGFGGHLIVHGHTPPAKHRAMSGFDDPHVIQHGRLCLDGGSAITGIVTGAEIESGRYRLLTARQS